MRVLALAGTLGWGAFPVHADDDQPDVRKVFVIAMENHNWTQPASVTSPQQISGNPAAPFINSLVNGASGISDQVAYATNYINAGINLGLHVHPSEPNYVWAEAGQAFNTIGTDDDPYFPGPSPAACTPDTVTTSDLHLTAFLAKAHKTWRAYEEDANVDLTSNVPLPMSSWTYPLFSHKGNFTSGINSYNYSTQYNYAAKHNPMIFFSDTNGGCPATASTLYPPLQQLALDLQSNKVADYTWITPDQCNDMHGITAKSAADISEPDCAGGESELSHALIRIGDDYLRQTVEGIRAAPVWKDDTAIIIVWDEDHYASASGTAGSPVGRNGAIMGGARAPLIVVTSKNSPARKIEAPFNHYNLLATLEAAYGLDCLGHACEAKSALIDGLFE